MIAAGARKPGLDVLRMIAGLGLLVAHGGWWLAPFHLPESVLFLLGYLGIEIFLAVVGLLAGLQLLGEDTPSAARFWLRRAWRLLPLYWLFLLLNLALVRSLGETFPPVWSYFSLTQNLVHPHPRFFAEAWIVPEIAVFYLFAPLICRPLRRHRRARSGVVWLLGLIACAHLIRLWWVLAGNPVWDEGVRKIVIARLDAPLYGLLVACLWRHRAFDDGRGRIALGGALALALTVVLYLTSSRDTSLFARVGLFTLGSLGCAAILPWFAAIKVPAVVARWTLPLAASAYVMLLTHMTLLRVLAIAGVPMTAHHRATGLAALFGYILLATVVGLAIRLCLDRPLLALRERFLPLAAEHGEPGAERRDASAP